jgi:hypothetical protein
MDLQVKHDQLAAENRSLAEGKAKADRDLEDALYNQ